MNRDPGANTITGIIECGQGGAGNQYPVTIRTELRLDNRFQMLEGHQGLPRDTVKNLQCVRPWKTAKLPFPIGTEGANRRRISLLAAPRGQEVGATAVKGIGFRLVRDAAKIPNACGAIPRCDQQVAVVLQEVKPLDRANVADGRHQWHDPAA